MPAREIVVAREAPPPPRVETMPPAPSGDAVWIAGYWAGRAGGREWVAGHWELPPRPGATWIAPKWELRGDNTYAFVEGYWQ